MAKINARGARQIGRTLYTEKDRPADAYDGDVERTYYEAFRLRSDGSVLTRIIRTWPTKGEGHTTEHSSGFRLLSLRVNVHLIETLPADEALTILRKHLIRKGYRIVKEK